MMFMHLALGMFTELQMEWISKELPCLSQLKTALELQILTQSMPEKCQKIFQETSDEEYDADLKGPKTKET